MKRRGGSVILKTTDAGNSWNTVLSDTASGLYSIYFPGSNIGYSAGLGGGMLKTTDGGDTWTHQNIAPHANIMSLYFTDDNTGYAAGYDDIDFTGILLKTINGGVNGDTLLYFPNFTSLTSVVFTDANTGYAVTATTGISSPEPSVKILKTENGGSSWSVLSGGATLSSCLHTVFFPDDSTGYAIGDSVGMYSFPLYPMILKTIDGGNIWNKVPFPAMSNISFSSVFFTDANTGYVAGGDVNYLASISKTTDGGETWTNLQLPVNSCYVRSVYFVTPSKGYAADWCGDIFYTTDAGSSWVADSSNTWNDLYSVFFPDSTAGYAVGEMSTILKKSIAGSTSVPGKQPGITTYNLWPNPADTKITVSSERMWNKEIEISILTMRGELLLKEKYHFQYQIQMDVGRLPLWWLFQHAIFHLSCGFKNR